MFSAIPPGWMFVSGSRQPVVSLTLNHRLISGIPPGWKPPC